MQVQYYMINTNSINIFVWESIWFILYNRIAIVLSLCGEINDLFIYSSWHEIVQAIFRLIPLTLGLGFLTWLHWCKIINTFINDI
jgi:hypothetical protein